VIGITSYGAYIPRYRMPRKVLREAIGWRYPVTMPGEKAVANYDEDSITMAVAAAIDCLTGIDRNVVDGVYFATTTPPFKEKQNARVIASALDLRTDIEVSDFTGSTRAGVTALIAACNAVKAGHAKNILVCASDMRLGASASPYEELYGDGAASFLVGEEGVIASLEGYHHVSYDFTGFWRTEWDKYQRSWEDRFIRDEAYVKFIPEAISKLLEKCAISPKDVAKLCYPATYPERYLSIAQALGFTPAQLQDPMLDKVGDTGTAHPLLMLVAALEDAKPKDRILVADFGEGSDALLLQVTDEVEKVRGKRRGVKKHVASKKVLESYEKYLLFRELVEAEVGLRGLETPPTSLSALWRSRREILAMVGVRCKRCGLPQFPAQRVCARCKAIDEMEPYRFSDKRGRVFSFTEDYLAYRPVPPGVYGFVEFEEGGRVMCEITDVEPGEVRVGMPVEMTFRRMSVDKRRGIIVYSWKATPVRVAE